MADHGRSRPLWLLAVTLTLAAGCNAETTLTGPAKITDGDSLEIHGTRIRLHAIDAPEGAQSCGRGGARWSCGTAARNKLEELIGGRPVTCRQRDTDDYGRAVAVCRAGTLDLGAAMVEAGFARAYRRFGDDYVREDAAAEAARRGVWAGDHEAPWDYRRGQRSRPAPSAAPAAASPQPGCLIKGNVNRRGERIYHLPGSNAYDTTRIDPSAGERWFCTEAEARAAGWRPPRR